MITATQELPNELKDCITACWDCRTICQKTLFNHCLEMGDAHSSTEHVRLMVDCMEACQVAADFMTRKSDLHPSMCAACAEVCYACAISCEDFDDEAMQACAQLCRECAEMCDDISLSQVVDSGETLSPAQMNFI